MTNHEEAVAKLNNFKATSFTTADGQKFTAVQISSQLSKLSDRERMLRKAAETEKQNAAQQAEIERLRGLLEGKGKKTATAA
jgi:hypothetical protein